MALKPNDILLRAADIIQDQTNVRWPQEELLRYLNDARREIAVVRPDLYATTSTVTLVAGTKQSLPTDGIRLIDVIRNMPAGAAGAAIRIVEREILDAQKPSWHTETASAATKHFMYDERNPRVYYLYPPATGSHQIEITYGQTPTDIALANIGSTELLQEDVYTGAMVDYVCYRAFSKDSEYAGNAGRAQAHYQQFINSLGLGGKVQMTQSPNTVNVGGRPSRALAAG
jgi:hypothetical protein